MIKLNIGEVIRSVRKKKGHTLKNIAMKTGLSIGFISQVETNKSSFGIESLMKISEALDVKPSYFFSITQQQNNSEDLYSLQTDGFEVIYRDLSGEFSNKEITPSLIELKPKKEKVKPLPHSGEEFIFVLKGILTIVFVDKMIDIHEGEHIHMKSTTPHNWMNFTEETINFLYIST